MQKKTKRLFVHADEFLYVNYKHVLQYVNGNAELVYVLKSRNLTVLTFQKLQVKLLPCSFLVPWL